MDEESICKLLELFFFFSPSRIGQECDGVQHDSITTIIVICVMDIKSAFVGDRFSHQFAIL